MRRGRKRKSGRRKPSGDLVGARGPSVAQVAAAMPHRRALGARASDPHAENELGRMLIRGEISVEQHAAGELYRKQWRGYLASLEAPALARMKLDDPTFAPQCALRCTDSVNEFCLCRERRRKWEETIDMLASSPSTGVIDRVVLLDKSARGEELWLLRLGLNLLAAHYGLKGRANQLNVGNAQSKTVRD